MPANEIETYTFPNGFRVIHQNPHNKLAAAAIQVFVNFGSAHETDDTRGMAHFIEHMCFKGTKKIPTPTDLYVKHDNAGGTFNASTNHRYTVYVCKIGDQDIPVIIPLLANMMLHSIFEKNEFKKEENVVIEENLRSEDNPIDLLSKDSGAIVYEGSSFHYPVDSLFYHKKKYNYNAVVDLYRLFYRPENMTLSIVTEVPFKTILRIISQSEYVKKGSKKELLDKRRHIQQYPPGTQINFVSFDNQNSLTRNGKDFFCPEGRRGRAGEPGFPARHILYYSVPELREIRYHFREKPGQKTTHMQMSFITCSMFDEDRHILNMLEHILGGLFGSKLSILLRENNGLTYTSKCTTEYHEHSGDISIYAQVDKRKLVKNGDKPGLIPLIIGLLNNLLKNGVTAEELNVAKKNKKAKLHLSLESLESQAEYNGKEWLLFQDPDNIVPIHKFYDRHFKGITRTQILGVLRKYIKKSSMIVCFVGEDFPSGVLIDRECQKLTNH